MFNKHGAKGTLCETAKQSHDESAEGQMIDESNRSFDILTEAVQRLVQHGVTKTDLLPSLVDFTASVAIALGGEEAIRACILRMGDRIKDCHDGTFPVRRNGSKTTLVRPTKSHPLAVVNAIFFVGYA